MAQNTIEYNISFPIKNPDGTSFHNLVINKAVYDSVVMSLGDKITGDVYYNDNTLRVTMEEYIEYDGVKYVLVNPPTVVREGMVSDNSQLKGMTKYSFVFYHPMYMLANFPFSDVAVSQSEEMYLSQNKTFSWIGTGLDFIAKLNKNLEQTQWIIVVSGNQDSRDKLSKMLSDVIQFDKNSIADAFKTCYEKWSVPFVISTIREGEEYYSQGKRFLVTFGLPTNEILVNGSPYIFRFGQGVGLKNNSRTPKNNKIITRIAGYGSEQNIPYGYPQIIWYGNQSWDYTINNDSTAPNSYPIYDGIVGGQKVRLIKHPFTRNHLMPSVYYETVFNKVSPYEPTTIVQRPRRNENYDPSIEIKDYYDAPARYPNPINQQAPSFEIHEFGDIKPELGNENIISAFPYNEESQKTETVFNSVESFLLTLATSITNASNENEKAAMTRLYNAISGGARAYTDSNNGGSYTFDCKVTNKDGIMYVKYTSDHFNIDTSVLYDPSNARWIDDMDDEGNYIQSYFKITLPQLSFDLYASAAITEEMKINMRSGYCLGCTFPVQVDWDDYKKNFYDANGNFDPVIGEGHPRNRNKYPDSSQEQITIIVQKDLDTFGTLMPDIYRQPRSGDEFVILGISLPSSYISNAETRLDDAMMEYMLENNVYYYDYPLKFDEYFFATNRDILAQIRNNNIVRFQYANDLPNGLYIKQITIKYGEGILPKYDITLTDDVEIVLNQIGQVTDDVSRMRVQVSELQKYYSQNIIDELNQKLSRINDDVCQGRITFQQGLNAIGNVIFSDELRSPNYANGLYDGKGWRIDNLGNAEMESLRVRSYLEVVELLINRLQAQEGDTLFSDNDQVDKVEMVVDETDNSVSYILSLKEKYDGYVTGQMYGNVLKGIINTLAAKQAGVSDEESTSVEVDGSNKYYTSWMRVIGTHNTNNALGVNQIQVVLYGDEFTPAGRNFVPCELMTIARWGCVDYSNPEDPDYEEIKASIIRRQRMFMISTTEGRVVKYMGVDSPILKNGNYGVTIGELPEFVKNYPDVARILSQIGEHTDWLYAQGVVVGNYVKVDREGLPVPVTVFCGEWEDGSQMQQPTVGHGIYFYNEYNEQSQQYEIHEVRHNGGRWQCLQHQPVVSCGVTTYNEPKWNSPYWILVDGNDNLTIEFVSSRGYSFRRDAVNTDITPHLFYGNVDITDEVAAEYWNWTRCSESNYNDGDPQYTPSDLHWNSAHENMKEIHLGNDDMPVTWSTVDKAIFTCTVIVNDGKNTIIISNQIIS